MSEQEQTTLLQEIRDNQLKQLSIQTEAFELQKQQFALYKQQFDKAAQLQDRAESLQERSRDLVEKGRKLFIFVVPILLIAIGYLSWLLFF